MKIQCDACEKEAATVICCADEAALCARCDVEVHAANKLASKHQRLVLDSLSNKLPCCDICQEKAAFIFCVEDRALFCQDCDESIHITGSLSGNHQRFLATGIRVALSSMCKKNSECSHTEPPNCTQPQLMPKTVPTQQNNPAITSATWSVDDFFALSDNEFTDKKESSPGFGELSWFSDIGLFPDQAPKDVSAAAEVPELIKSTPSNAMFYRSSKSSMSNKKARIEISLSDDDDYFTVPDLG